VVYSIIGSLIREIPTPGVNITITTHTARHSYSNNNIYSITEQYTEIVWPDVQSQGNLELSIYRGSISTHFKALIALNYDHLI